MTDEMSEATARTLIAYMRGYWPPLDDDPEVVHAWQVAMKGITWAEAHDAVDWIGANTQREFAPTPGIVRARVLNSRGPAPAELPEEITDDVPQNLTERQKQMARIRQTPEYKDARAALARAKAGRVAVPGMRSIGESLEETIG